MWQYLITENVVMCNVPEKLTDCLPSDLRADILKEEFTLNWKY